MKDDDIINFIKDKSEEEEKKFKKEWIEGMESVCKECEKINPELGEICRNAKKDAIKTVEENKRKSKS